MSPKLFSRHSLLAIASVAIIVCGFVLWYWYPNWREKLPKSDHALIVVEVVLIFVVSLEIYHLRVTRRGVDNAVVVMERTVQDVEKHVATIASSVRLLERDKIYFYLSETARNAKRSVHHLSLAHASLEIPDDEERKRVREFLEALRASAGRLGSESVKILGPDLSAKIGGLWERKKAGCSVKVSPAVSNYDIRIQIVDGEKVVIGVGVPAKPSESGFLIESEVLARMLDEDFLAIWKRADTLPLEAHTASVVTRQVATVPLSLKHLHDIIKDQLHVTQEDVNDIQNLLEQSGHLVCDGSDVYRGKVFDGCLGLPDCSREGIEKHLRESGITITDMCLDRLHRYVRIVGTGLKIPDPTAEKVKELVLEEGGDASDYGVERLRGLLARRKVVPVSMLAQRPTAVNADEVDHG